MKKKKKWEPRWDQFQKGHLPPNEMAIAEADDVWLNNLYQVNIRWEFRGMIHLSIKRRNKDPIMDWRHLQRIKNELLGPEYEMVQLFPAESRLVDTANQYHFFALPNKGKFPIGYEDGRLVTDTSGIGGARQRPGTATEEDEINFQERLIAAHLKAKEKEEQSEQN